MPLTHQQWGTDVGMRKQQRSYGITALALSKGLELMEGPISQLTQLPESLPDEDARSRMYEAIQNIQNEALAPVGHALRFLASNYNDLAIRRKDMAIYHVKDAILQQQLKTQQLGFSSFFKEDVSALLGGKQRGGGKEAYHQSETSQSLCEKETLQDDYLKRGSSGYKAQGLDGDHRFKGCVPSYPCAQGIQTIPSLPVEGQCISVLQAPL